MSMNNDIPPVTDEQRKMLLELVEMMGVKELSARVDRQEQGMEEIKVSLNSLIESHNKLVTSLGANQSTTAITPTATQSEKIQALGQLVTALEPLANRIWPVNTPQAHIIDQEYINEKVKKSVMGNFEVGEALIDNLKSKIIGKAMTKVVTGIVSHEPV